MVVRLYYYFLQIIIIFLLMKCYRHSDAFRIRRKLGTGSAGTAGLQASQSLTTVNTLDVLSHCVDKFNTLDVLSSYRWVTYARPIDRYENLILGL